MKLVDRLTCSKHELAYDFVTVLWLFVVVVVVVVDVVVVVAVVVVVVFVSG